MRFSDLHPDPRATAPLADLEPHWFERDTTHLYFWAAAAVGVDRGRLLNVTRAVIEAVAEDAGDTERTRAAVADARTFLVPDGDDTRRPERGDPLHPDFSSGIVGALVDAYLSSPCEHCGEQPGDGAGERAARRVHAIAVPVIRALLPEAAEAVDRRRREVVTAALLEDEA